MAFLCLCGTCISIMIVQYACAQLTEPEHRKAKCVHLACGRQNGSVPYMLQILKLFLPAMQCGLFAREGYPERVELRFVSACLGHFANIKLRTYM
jgi:hypothetical protein